MNTPEKEGPGGETGAKDDGANQSCCTNSHWGGQKQGTSSADPKSNGERPPWFGIEISMVGSATETKTESVTISSVLEDIRDGRWKNPVGRVKENYSSEFAKAAQEGDPDPAATAKKAVNGAKKELPGILFSGKFSGRANDKLEDHSGFLGLDLDNLGERLEPLRQRLKTDPRVQVFFVSPTGTGLKVLLRIHPDKDVHRRSFEAAKGYFREAYDVGIDNCPDVSRLCYVCHDPDIFIRAEDAIVLEPLPEEAKPEPEFPSTEEIKDLIGPKGVILPSGDTDYTDSASMLYPVLKSSKRFFVSNGLVGTLITHKNESRSFNPISDHEFCSAIERPAHLFGWRVSSHGKPVLKPKVRCSTDQAKKLLAAEQRFLLPNITAIHNCPIIAEMPDGSVSVLGPGYHSHAGGRLVTGGELPAVPRSLEEAIGIILDMVREVSWLTPADQSRWICALLEPAFKSLCDWPFPSPLFIMEADASQAGKGYLFNLISVTYREFPTLVTQSGKGVGGFDESLSHAFLQARPIILFDNIRGSIKSTKLEAAITCPIGSDIAARIPYRPETRVDPHNYIFQLTSNGLDTTEDLANRSCISRILYQGERAFARYPEGSILDHVRANQPKYLGAAHRIVREWYERGKQFSRTDCRGVGAFRDWWQRSDWILTRLFELPSPLDGHSVAQKRAANPTLGWLRELFIKLKNADLNEQRGLSATDIFNFCELNDIEVPCRFGEASKDEKAQVQRIGKLMAPLFSPVKDVWQGEGFSIKRIEEPYYDPWHGEKTSKRYLFFEGPEPPDVRRPVPPLPPIGPLAG